MMDKITMARHLLPRQLVSETFPTNLNNNVSAPSDGLLGDINQDDVKVAMAIMGMTVMGFIVLLMSIRYTLGIVATLAMVETPVNTYLDADEKTANNSDPEVLVVREAPITASIRRTIRHLVSRGGRAARWRGFWVFLTYTLSFYLVDNLFRMFRFTPYVYGGSLARVVAQLLIHLFAGVGAELVLARLSMTWTHVVITEPSTKTWYSRVPPRKTWKKVALPTVVRSFCLQLSGYLPAVVFFSMNIDRHSATAKPGVIAGKLVAVAAVGLMTFVGLYIPSEVTLTRIQASLLPEEDETIVNVDRAFNGRVVPEILGGSGCVSFMGAWKSFDGPARVRLLKLFAKWGLIELAFHLVMAVVVYVEFLALIAHNNGKKPE